MEVKIKSNNEMIDATIEVINGVMVVSPISKFEPKDGDVVATTDGCYLFIYKDGYVAETGSGNVHVVFSSVLFSTTSIEGWRFSRYATEKEKQKLFDKLAEEGWEWKADTKELVKLKWKPQNDQDYWYPDFSHNEKNTIGYYPRETAFSEKCEFDMSVFKHGWCFKTEAECQEFCDKLNEAINQVKP